MASAQTLRDSSNEDLRELIRQAAREETVGAFTDLDTYFAHIEEQPERRWELSDVVADVVARYVSMSGVTGKMLEDKRVGPSDVVNAGIETLGTLADASGASFGNTPTLQSLIKAQQKADIDEDIRSELITLVGRCCGVPDARIINEVVPALEAAIGDDERRPVYRAATRAAGRLIAAGVEPASELVRPLETAADDDNALKMIFAVVGAGIALTAPDPPTERLYDILPQPEATHLPVESTQDKILIKARAKAACYALTGTAAVRHAERDVLERFVTQDDPTVRRTVPAGLKAVFRDGWTVPSEPAQELLATALDDDEDEDVRATAVEAIEAALEAGVEDADEYADLLRQALDELDGAAREEAFRTIGTLADRSEELVAADIDVTEFGTAVRESALTDKNPSIRRAALASSHAADQFSTAQSYHICIASTDDDDGEPASGNERSTEDRAEDLRESHDPCDYPRLYEEAESDKRDVILKVVELSEPDHSLEAIEAFKTTLRTAWDDAVDTGEGRRQHVLGCVQTGCENNNFGAPFVDEFVERAWQTAVPTLRGRALELLGTAIEAGIYEWNEVSDRLSVAFESGTPRLVEGALSAITDAVLTSELSVTQYLTHLDRGFSENVTVAAAAQESLRKVVLNDLVSWDEIKDWVTDGLAHEAPDVVQAAVSVVGASAQAGLVGWTQVGAHLVDAVGHEQSAVAREAVKATYVGTDERFDWTEGEPLLWVALAHHGHDAARAAVGIDYLGARLYHGTLSWADVSDLVSEALADPRPGVAEAAADSVAHGLAGDLSWDQVDGLLMAVLEHDESAVVLMATEAVRESVASGRIEWSTAEPYLRQAVGHHDSDVSNEVGNIVAVGICEGEFRWSQVEAFLWRELVRDEAAQAAAAAHATCMCLYNEAIGWDAGGLLLRIALRQADYELAESIIYSVMPVVRERPTDWADIEALLELGLAHNASEVNKLTVDIVGIGLEAGRFAWSDAAGFLRDLLVDGRPELATEAVLTVVYATHSEQLTWGDIPDFVECALTDTDDAVARKVIGFILFDEGNELALSTALDLILQHRYLEQPQSVRLMILEGISSSEAHAEVLTDHRDFLRAIPEEPNPGLLAYAVRQVVMPCIDREAGYEDVLLEVLSDIFEETTDPHVQEHAYLAVRRGRSVLNTDGQWSSLLNAIVLDDRYRSVLRGLALLSLTEKAEFPTTGDLVSTLDSLVADAGADELLREIAMARAGVILAESDVERGDAPDVRTQLNDILRDGLADSEERVQQAAAEAIAKSNRQREFPISRDQIDALRRVVAAGDLSPDTRLELTDILARLDEPVEYVPPGSG
jgi:hypothetical protein